MPVIASRGAHSHWPTWAAAGWAESRVGEAREKEASRQEQSRTQERTLRCVEEERAVVAHQVRVFAAQCCASVSISLTQIMTVPLVVFIDEGGSQNAINVSVLPGGQLGSTGQLGSGKVTGFPGQLGSTSQIHFSQMTRFLEIT